VAKKAWSGVFSQATDRRVEQFTESISFDRRLYAHDILASIAHAQMLAKVGLIAAEECRQIEQGLESIRQEIEQGKFEFSVELEDIHLHIERALIERIGDAGRKLHTARSRNDQVSTDLRLWCRDAIEELDEQLSHLQRAFGCCLTMSKRVLPTRTCSAPAGVGGTLLVGLLRKAAARPRSVVGLPPPRERAAAGFRRTGGNHFADRPRRCRPAFGFHRRGACRASKVVPKPDVATATRRQQPRRHERSRFRRRAGLRAGDDRRTPQRLGGGMDFV
jgi:hypothetical protein